MMFRIGNEIEYWVLTLHGKIALSLPQHFQY